MMYFDCALDSSMVDALLKTNGTFIDVHVKFHTQAQQDFPYFWGKKVPLNWLVAQVHFQERSSSSTYSFKKIRRDFFSVL